MSVKCKQSYYLQTVGLYNNYIRNPIYLLYAHLWFLWATFAAELNLARG